MPTKEELRAAIDKALEIKNLEDELIAHRKRVLDKYHIILDDRYIKEDGKYGRSDRKARRHEAQLRRSQRHHGH